MQLEALLEQLKLTHLSLQLETVLEQAAKRELGYRELLAEVFACEWAGRRQKGTESRLAQARLPWHKTLEQFDFSFQPSIDRKVIAELATLSFVDRAENLVLLGPPGVGKTHIAIALAVKAAEAGHRVLFLTLQELMGRLKKARAESRLDKQLQQLSYPKVLVLDEIGYLPLSREDASLFFQLVAKRYERASMILTSNKSFLDWGEVFGDPVLATAILDRLLHQQAARAVLGQGWHRRTLRVQRRLRDRWPILSGLRRRHR